MPRMAAKPKTKPGPTELRVKTDLSFRDAVRTALAKKRPAGGWPEAPNKPTKKRKTAKKRAKSS